MKLVIQDKPLRDPISNRILSSGSIDYMEKYCAAVNVFGFDYAIALATEAEVANGSACGQLAMIVEEVPEKDLRPAK